jgi:molecular chaperone GrpE
MMKKSKHKVDEKEELKMNEEADQNQDNIPEEGISAGNESEFEVESENLQVETDEEKEDDSVSQLIDEMTQKLSASEATSRDLQDKYLRLSAEFDNYRKRTLKEKMDLTKQANSDLLKDILSVVDDFERGMQLIEKSEDIAALKEGIIHIYNKFTEFIRQNGVKEIEAKDKDFDIDFHEALTKIPAPTEEQKGKVVDVVEKGYMLNDKVLRYSKVVVGE